MFDGTSRLSELLNNVLRFVTPDFVIVQRLALLLTYASHLTGVQLSKILTTLFLTTFSLPIDRLIGFGRDSASANERSTSRTQAENFACPQRTPHLHSPHLLSTCTHSTPFHLVLPSHAGKFPLIYASTYSFY